MNVRILSVVVGLSAILNLASPAWAVCDASQPSRKPIGQYVINGGTVYDKKGDLTWSRCSVGQRWVDGVGCAGVIKEMTWNEALQQAYGGWRVPTKDELATLVSPTCKNPSINEEAFPDMELNKLVYWTSDENGASGAWGVHFDDGHIRKYILLPPFEYFAVRLVRGGEWHGGYQS